MNKPTAFKLIAWHLGLSLLMLESPGTFGAKFATQDITQKANSAYQEQRFEDFASFLTVLSERWPYNLNIRTNLARANILTNNTVGARRELDLIADQGMFIDLTGDPSFDGLKDNSNFQTILISYNKNQSPKGSDKKGLAIDRTELLPEIVAFDHAGGHDFISSVRNGEILEVQPGPDTESQIVSVIAPAKGAITGLKLDNNRSLWAGVAELLTLEGQC